MNYKKSLFILCLFICIVFTITSACASDLDNSTTQINEKLETTDDNTVIKDTNEETVIGDTDDGSREALESKIENAYETATITLENNYTLSGPDYGVSINKYLTIDGAGFTIDGNGQQIFAIEQTGYVTLKNIIFINGVSSGSGGAIFNNGHLTVINCTFKNNHVTGYAQGGGAICNYNSELTIINSTFTNNKVTEYSGDGGAIYTYKGTLNIINSTFKDNLVSGEWDSGGAVSNEGGTLTVINSRFNNNTASGDYSKGGAIANSWEHNSNKYGYAIIINSTFCDNYIEGSQCYGESIYNELGNLTAINSTFNRKLSRTSHSAVYNKYNEKIINCTFYNDNGISGRAVFNSGNILEIINSTFVNNSADNGGAAYNQYGALIITNSTFTNNYASWIGGAVYSESHNGLTIINSEFTKNIAYYNGGAVYLSSGDLTIINSTLSNNNAKNGGAICDNGNSLTLINSTIENNKGNQGSGIYADIKTSKIKYNRFINNTVNGVKLDDTNKIINQPNFVINSIIENNTLKLVIFETENSRNFNGNITLITLNKNYTIPIIGGIGETDELNLGIGSYGITINFNEPGEYPPVSRYIGFDVVNPDSFTQLKTLIGYNIYKNKYEITLNSDYTYSINDYKDILYFDISDYDIDFTINGNGHTLNGANSAKGFEIYNSNMIIKNLNIINCNSDSGIYSGNSRLTIINTTFENNANNNVGGAITAISCTLSVFNSTFKNNYARYGGAIYVESSQFSLINSTFDKNMASEGSAIYASDIKNENVHYNTFINNTVYDLFLDNTNTLFNSPAFEIFTVSEPDSSLRIILRELNNGVVFEGNVSVSIDGENYTVNLVNGIGKSEKITSITPGNYQSTITFNESDKYPPVSQTVYFEAVRPNSYSDLYNLILYNIYSQNYEISLNQDYAYESNDNTDGIKIENMNNLTINGNGHTISGKGQARIFNLYEANLTLKNLNLTNGYSMYGGAIVNEGGKLTIINSTFSENYATSGGAIFNDGGDATIINSLFTANTCQDYGGAIMNAGNNVTIINSTFNNNKASSAGGAIYNQASNVTIINSTINSTQVECGAIFNTETELLIIASNITNNQASTSGALYAENTNITLISTLIKNNTAQSLSGAITCRSVVMTIINTTFEKNHGNDLAGLFIEEGEISISNSEFIENNGDTCGAIAARSVNMTVTDSTFFKNQANQLAGIFALTSNLTIISSNFTGNLGGALFTYSANATIINTTFEDNNGGQGGAVWSQESNMTINNSTFNRNRANMGGAIFNQDGSLIISESSIANNTGNEGGAIFATSSRLMINSTNLTNNTSYDKGGAILNSNSLTTIMNSTLKDNTAYDGGGAIYNSNSYTTIINSEFANNNASNEGGAINNYGPLNIYDSTFNNNTAEKGGVIVTYDSTTVISNSSFTNNSANSSGAIYADEGELRIISSNFTNNCANETGAIMNKDATAIIYNSVFKNNKANSTAGVIYTAYGTLIVSNSTLTNNSAENAGVIYSVSTQTIIQSSSITDNSAQKGGAIYLSFSSVAVQNSNLTGNTANEGGAIYAELGQVGIYSSNIQDNTAQKGGAIYATKGMMSIQSSNLTGNAANEGGAIYVENIQTTMSNSTLTGNTANAGGAIYNNDSNIQVTGSVFTNNQATGNTSCSGGAILNSGVLNITNSVFENNTAEGSLNSTGGAIGIYGNTTICNSTFHANTAQNGSALWSDKNETISVTDSKFVDDDVAGIDLDDTNKFLTQPAFEFFIPNFVNGTAIEITVNETKQKSFNGTVVIIIGNENFTVDLINGSGTISITPKIKPGTYTATLVFNQTSIYNDVIMQSNVFKVISDQPVETFINITSPEKGTIIITLTDGENPVAGAVIKYTINGNEYNATTKNDGTWTITTSLIGNVEIKANYDGNKSYKATSKTETFRFQNASFINITSSQNRKITIRLTDGANPISGAVIKYTINGNQYNTTTKNDGTCTITTTLSGNVTIEVIYDGSDAYKATSGSKTFNFTSEKINTTITLDSPEKGKITVTLTDGANPVAGAAIKYTINGNQYNATTGNDGTFTITTTLTGNVEVKVTYDGDSAYMASSGSKTFNFPADKPKVIAKKTKITAKKKTFKRKVKTKKYSITLKAGSKAVSKVKVTLKIKGKTYKATTNSKGKATFKITKLTKKGKYTATIKFKGNANYKASSKKVKITIK